MPCISQDRTLVVCFTSISTLQPALMLVGTLKAAASWAPGIVINLSDQIIFKPSSHSSPRLVLGRGEV